MGKWDKRYVTFILTEYTGDMVETETRTGESKLKPNILSYNIINLCGVDRRDQMSYNGYNKKQSGVCKIIHKYFRIVSTKLLLFV